MPSLTAAEISNSQPTQSAPNSARRPINVVTSVPSAPTPASTTRRSSLTAAKLATPGGSSFRMSSRSDAHRGGSPRPSTAPDSDHGMDDSRPTTAAGGASMSTKSYDRDSSKFHDRDSSKFHDRDSDRVRGDGGGDSDTFRIDPIPHMNRSSSARSSDGGGHGLPSQFASRPNSISHLGTKEDDATLNWNGARSYSSRKSASFDVPLDNSLGRSHSFSGLHLKVSCIFKHLLLL